MDLLISRVLKINDDDDELTKLQPATVRYCWFSDISVLQGSVATQ